MQARSTRLALAEDDPEQRSLIAEILRHGGFDVIEASDGAALLAILRGAAVDLVVTDLWMPQLTGTDVATARRHDGDRTPFIIITAAPRSAIAPLATLEGVTLLPKPFTVERLLTTVASVLDGGPFAH